MNRTRERVILTRLINISRRTAVSVALLSIAFGDARAQDVIRVVPGWGIDTSSSGSADYTSQGPVPEIFRAWREYLQTAAQSQRPTPLWTATEQGRFPYYDITASNGAYQGFPATVLSIQRSPSGNPDEYVVRTLFASANGPNKDVKPIALTRVYAIRENGRWVFANALPRLTSRWERHTVGPIHYFVQPGHKYDSAKARGAARFVDSVAKLFNVPRPIDIEYYVADNPEEIHRIAGFDFQVGGEQASYADVARRMILVGSPVFGENHRHELTHAVLYPVIVAGRMPGIVNEGIATWLGGSLGKAFEGVMKDYAAFLSAHPAITLDSVLTVTEHDYGTRPAGAALVALAYQHGGIAAVKTLTSGGRSDDDLRASAMKVFGEPWSGIEARWRRYVLGFADSPQSPRRQLH